MARLLLIRKSSDNFLKKIKSKEDFMKKLGFVAIFATLILSLNLLTSVYLGLELLP